jgi:tripartite-type tricarboxylate transporter receptor subunit TctC
MEEAGVPGYEINEWNPILAPAGLAKPAKTALQVALRTALADPEVLGRVRALSGEMFPGDTDAALGDYLKAQKSQWARIVKERKISVD